MSIADVIAELFPNGKRQGKEWLVGSLTGQPGKSLRIDIIGKKSGCWIDFASGERGGIIKLVMAKQNMPFREAIQWLEDRGVKNLAPLAGERPAPSRISIKPEEDYATKMRRQQDIDHAWQLFNASAPIEGHGGLSIAQMYFINRGYTGTFSPYLRYHAKVLHSPSKQYLPCLVAAMVDGAKKFVGVHRTYLDPSGSKAKVEPNRMMLGNHKGSAVWLYDPNKPEYKNPRVLGICEGIETGVSAQELMNIPFWAALSAGNMKHVTLPQSVKEVMIAYDNDMTGTHTMREADIVLKARHPWIKSVVCVSPQKTPKVKDFNDYAYKKLMLQDITEAYI